MPVIVLALSPSTSAAICSAQGASHWLVAKPASQAALVLHDGGDLVHLAVGLGQLQEGRQLLGICGLLEVREGGAEQPEDGAAWAHRGRA